jgi:hypothetical protein
VRLTSLELATAPGTLTGETTTDQNGWFSPDILPGKWRVELIPPFDTPLSPRTETFEVPAAGGSEAIELLPRVEIEPTVVDSDGVVVAGASVTIVETGFDRYAFSALTGDDGTAELVVSDVAVDVTIVPPPGSPDAITHFWYASPRDVPDELPLADGTLFQGVVTGPRGDAVSGAVLELRSGDDTEPFARTRTADDGSFELRVDVERP